MQRNRKSDNELFTLFEDGTLHLYDNLVEVSVEHGGETITQYEGDLYILNTKMQEHEVGKLYNTLVEMIATCDAQGVKVSCTSELPAKYLTATDWVDIQLTRTERLHGRESSEYIQLLDKRIDTLACREYAVGLVGVIK